MSFWSSKNGDNILPFPGRKIAPEPASLLPVLIVLHQETSTPGRVGNALRALGHPLDIRRRGSAIPCRQRWIGMPGRSFSAAR